MKIRVSVKTTQEEINILEKAKELISTIAQDIDDEMIRHFNGLDYDDLRDTEERLNEIINGLKDDRYVRE